MLVAATVAQPRGGVSVRLVVGISPLYRQYVVAICAHTKTKFDLKERSCTQVSRHSRLEGFGDLRKL